jgi:hypothetical protein
MGLCFSEPVDVVGRAEINIVKQQVIELQQQLNEKNIESATYQKQLIEQALNEKCEQAYAELGDLNAIVLQMQQAKAALQESKAAMGQAKEVISDATGCIRLTDEFRLVTTLSLVCFYGKGKTWVEILPVNGEQYTLPTMLDYNGNIIGTTALAHKGDQVKSGGYDENRVAYLVPLKR